MGGDEGAGYDLLLIGTIRKLARPNSSDSISDDANMTSLSSAALISQMP